MHVQGAENRRFGEDRPEALQQETLSVPQICGGHGAVESQGHRVQGRFFLLLPGDGEDLAPDPVIELPVYQPVGHRADEQGGHRGIARGFQSIQNAGEGVVGCPAADNILSPEDLKVLFSGDDGIKGIGFVGHGGNQNAFHALASST